MTGFRYGAFRPPGRHQRLGVLTPAGAVLDLSELALEYPLPWPELLLEPTLDALLAAGAAAWGEVYGWLGERRISAVLPCSTICPCRITRMRSV